MSETTTNPVPYSQEAEEALLGAIITNPINYPVIAGFLKAQDFFFVRHLYIWQAIANIADAKETIDYITLCKRLMDVNQLELIGGPAYITQLINSAPSSSNAEIYARLVERASIRRRLIVGADKIKALAHDESLTLEDVVAGTEKELSEVRNRTGSGDETTFDVMLHDYLDELERRMNAPKGVVGIASGLTDLDEITGGWEAPNLVVLAGRPGMGKTALALNFTVEALKQDKKVAFFSLEMTDKQLVARLVAQHAHVNAEKQKRGMLEGGDLVKIYNTAGEFQKYKNHLLLSDMPNLNPLQLRAKCLRQQATHGLDLIIVDYLQLMNSTERHTNGNERVSAISRALKNLALELKVPVIALAQLSRGVEQRQDKRPILSDLRDSGAIEQDADEVIFVYRDAVYNDDSEFPNNADLIVAKNRDGRTGTAMVYFDRAITSFMNGVKRKVDLREPVSNGRYHDD